MLVDDGMKLYTFCTLVFGFFFLDIKAPIVKSFFIASKEAQKTTIGNIELNFPNW